MTYYEMFQTLFLFLAVFMAISVIAGMVKFALDQERKNKEKEKRRENPYVIFGSDEDG